MPIKLENKSRYPKNWLQGNAWKFSPKLKITFGETVVVLIR